MNEDSKYYSNMVNNFLKQYKEFTKVAENYESKLSDFNDTLKAVMDNQKLSGTESEMLLKNEYDDKFYILSKEKILLHVKNDVNKTLSDSSLYSVINIDLNQYKNKIINESVNGVDNVYYKYDGHNASVIDQGTSGLSNTIAQVGLSDLAFSTTDNFVLKSLPNTTNASLDTNTTSYQCTVEDAYKCESYAKMNDKLHYGLMSNEDSNKCECYVFENTNTLKNANTVINTIDVDSTKLNGLQHLGLLFDGGLYGLKKSKYSDNFTGTFVPNSDDMITMITPKQIIGTDLLCNPFTGHGPYNIIPQSFDKGESCNVVDTEYKNIYSQATVNVSKPSYLNICSTHADKTTDIFTSYYKFGKDDANLNDTFYSYANSKFSKYYYNTGSELYVCNDACGNELNPLIDVTYESNGVSGQISATTYGRDFMNTLCTTTPSVSCDISNAKVYIDASYNLTTSNGKLKSVHLVVEYDHDGASYDSSYLLYSDDGTNTIMKNSLDDFTVPSDVKYQLNLDTSSEKIELLSRSTFDDNEESIGGALALYSSDNKLRLIIGKDGLLKLQTKKINTSTFTSSSFKYGTYDNSLNDITIPINSLVDEDKNKLGSNVGKIGYIGYDNTLKLINNNKNIVKNSGVNFENYPYYSHNDYSQLTEYTGTTIDASCGEDVDCVGYITKNVSGTNKYYKIPSNQLSNIYSGDSTQTSNYNFSFKKNGIYLNDTYLLNSNLTNIYNIDSFNKLSKTKKDNAIFVEYIVQNNHNELKSLKTAFIDSYLNIISLFQKLSDEEMNILRNTGIKANQISDTIKKYTALYMKVSKNENKNQTLDIEKEDYNILNNRTRLHMAAAGIGTVLSLLALFRIMRR